MRTLYLLYDSARISILRKAVNNGTTPTMTPFTTTGGNVGDCWDPPGGLGSPYLLPLSVAMTPMNLRQMYIPKSCSPETLHAKHNLQDPLYKRLQTPSKANKPKSIK